MKRAAIKSATALAIGASMLSLSACASIFAGTSRNITVKTEPAAATCDLTRQGVQVGATGQTPEAVRVSRSRHNILVNCEKPGYKKGSTIVVSEFEPWVLGNVMIGGIIGLGVDLSSGAYMDYPPEAFVRLSPQPGMAPHASTAPQAPGPQGTVVQTYNYSPNRSYAAQSAQPAQPAQPNYVAAPSDYSVYQQGYGSRLSYSDRVAQYGQDLKRINDDADIAITNARANCLWGDPLEWIGDQDQAGCEAQVAQIEAERARAIAQLDQQWRGTYMP